MRRGRARHSKTDAAVSVAALYSRGVTEARRSSSSRAHSKEPLETHATQISIPLDHVIYSLVFVEDPRAWVIGTVRNTIKHRILHRRPFLGRPPCCGYVGLNQRCRSAALSRAHGDDCLHSERGGESCSKRTGPSCRPSKQRHHEPNGGVRQDERDGGKDQLPSDDDAKRPQTTTQTRELHIRCVSFAALSFVAYAHVALHGSAAPSSLITSVSLTPHDSRRFACLHNTSLEDTPVTQPRGPMRAHPSFMVCTSHSPGVLFSVQGRL